MEILKNLLGNNSKIHMDEIAVDRLRLLKDAIILEKGNNINGEYIKLGDGTLICWKFITLKYVNTSYLEYVWTYPSSYYSNVVALANRSARWSLTRFFAGSISTTPNVSTCTIHLYKTVENFQSGDEEEGIAVAIGRWK